MADETAVRALNGFLVAKTTAQAFNRNFKIETTQRHCRCHFLNDNPYTKLKTIKFDKIYKQ